MKDKSKMSKETPFGSDAILDELVGRVSKVRKRLVIEAILKTLAMGLIVLPIYVALYAWLDHRIHFGPVLRMIALVVLVVCVGWLLLRWARVFSSHISLSRAANYIEGNHSYQQQLVAAIEYYEQQADYPYSRGLAEQMIAQVYRQSQEQDFVCTVKKWPSAISLGVILFAVTCMCFLIGSHYRYYSRYFTRLVNPVSQVEPLPPTELIITSGDIIAEPGETLTLTAAIVGRKPENGMLFIESEMVSSEPNRTELDQRMKIPLLAGVSKDNEPMFSAQMSLRQKGKYRYYFQVGQAESQSQTIQITEFPKIQSVTAEIMATDSMWVKPYTEEVANLSLVVFRGAYVTLKVKTNQPLDKAHVTLPDERQVEGQLQTPDEFIVAFRAKDAGKVEFRLTNTTGLKTREAAVLRINLKEDNPPEFKLISPTSDYIASNVASVPIEFEVSDDFALRSASLNLEFNNGEVIRMPIEGLKKGSRKTTASFLLELEDYDLDISDSIIFYAVASDVDTGIGTANQTAWSTPYFVEIRPYRKLIKQPPPSLPSTEKQGMRPSTGHESLMAILEYNRAFLKKTWSLSQKNELTQPDKSRLTAISDDVEHTSSQLTMIRDDPEYEFTDEQIQAISGVITDYEQASRTLVKYQPKQALPPEKHAYHEVRALIRELMECPPPTGGMKPETRDKLELKDPVHVTRFEKERIEWQLEKVAQELAELAKEQDKLKAEFVKFFESQKKNKPEQEVTDAKTWIEEHETEVPRKPPMDGKPAMTENDTSVQGAMVNLKDPNPMAGGSAQDLPPNKEQRDQPENQSEQQSQSAQNKKNSEKQDGQGASGQQVTANEMLRIMRAQQKMLQKQLDELSDKLAEIPIPDEPVDGDGTAAEDIRQVAQEHLANAGEHMDRFDDELADQYYDADISEESLARAEGHLKAAGQAMNRAGLEMAREYAGLNQQLAMQSESLAKQLESLADAYDESVSEVEKEKLQQLLQQASQMLESLPEDWWQDSETELGVYVPDTTRTMSPDAEMLAIETKAEELRGQQRMNPAHLDSPPSGSPQKAGNPTSVAGGGRGSNSLRTQGELSSEAREKARHFWSVAIKARQKSTALTETHYSHPEFVDEENRFFEKTATYGAKQEQP